MLELYSIKIFFSYVSTMPVIKSGPRGAIYGIRTFGGYHDLGLITTPGTIILQPIVAAYYHITANSSGIIIQLPDVSSSGDNQGENLAFPGDIINISNRFLSSNSIVVNNFSSAPLVTLIPDRVIQLVAIETGDNWEIFESSIVNPIGPGVYPSQSAVFTNASGDIATDNVNYNYDFANVRLAIGTDSHSAGRLTVLGSSTGSDSQITSNAIITSSTSDTVAYSNIFTNNSNNRAISYSGNISGTSSSNHVGLDLGIANSGTGSSTGVALNIADSGGNSRCIDFTTSTAKAFNFSSSHSTNNSISVEIEGSARNLPTIATSANAGSLMYAETVSGDIATDSNLQWTSNNLIIASEALGSGKLIQSIGSVTSASSITGYSATLANAGAGDVVGLELAITESGSGSACIDFTDSDAEAFRFSSNHVTNNTIAISVDGSPRKIPTISNSSVNAGAVMHAGTTSGDIATDPDFIWDSTSNKLSITTSPAGGMLLETGGTVSGGTPAAMIGYHSSYVNNSTPSNVACFSGSISGIGTGEHVGLNLIIGGNNADFLKGSKISVSGNSSNKFTGSHLAVSNSGAGDSIGLTLDVSGTSTNSACLDFAASNVDAFSFSSSQSSNNSLNVKVGGADRRIPTVPRTGIIASGIAYVQNTSGDILTDNNLTWIANTLNAGMVATGGTLIESGGTVSGSGVSTSKIYSGSLVDNSTNSASISGYSSSITGTGDGPNIGMDLILGNSGMGSHTGVNVTVNGTGNGTHKGANYIVGGGTGSHIGIDLTITGTGVTKGISMNVPSGGTCVDFGTSVGRAFYFSSGHSTNNTVQVSVGGTSRNLPTIATSVTSGAIMYAGTTSGDIMTNSQFNWNNGLFLPVPSIGGNILQNTGSSFSGTPASSLAWSSFNINNTTTNSTSVTGNNISISGTSNGSHVGIDLLINGSGTGIKRGLEATIGGGGMTTGAYLDITAGSSGSACIDFTTSDAIAFEFSPNHSAGSSVIDVSINSTPRKITTIANSTFAAGSVMFAGSTNGDIAMSSDFTWNDSTKILKVASSEISLGISSGATNQGSEAVAIGFTAGSTNQGTEAVALGSQAGNSGQGDYSVVLGASAGQTDIGAYSIGIGYNAGSTSLPSHSLILNASNVPTNNLGINSIVLNARNEDDADQLVLGGDNTITINANNQTAGNIVTNSGNGSILVNSSNANISNTGTNNVILNASALSLSNSLNNTFIVKPVRGTDTSTYNGRVMVYDNGTGEVVYDNTTGKTFVIDHPIDENKYLVHSCLEGPELGVYYRGKTESIDGECLIELPNYAHKIAYDFTVQVTPIYERKKINYFGVSEVVNGKFTIHGSGKFHWHVYGKRSSIFAEPNRQDHILRGSGPYTWLESVHQQE